jgi:hypothetical protein
MDARLALLPAEERSMDELTVEEWVRERLDNCQTLAAKKVGADREGWLEDARYFQRILERITLPSGEAKC